MNQKMIQLTKLIQKEINGWDISEGGQQDEVERSKGRFILDQNQ